jgi:hypothetical protein
MLNLDDIAAFACDHGHNLTRPLSHAQVVALANAWFPEIRFHENERFHPVDLPGLLRIPPEVFANLPESAKKEFRVGVHTDTLNDGQHHIEHFSPPVVHIDSGDARRVLGHGIGVASAMADPALDRSAIFTYGARLEAGREFFGASDTVAGATEPAPGDPRRPRHLPIVVHAELRVLLETLKHELELDDLPDGDKPIDAIWSGFAVEELFFVYQGSGGGPSGPPPPPPVFTRLQKRNVLRALVAAHVAGDPAAWQAALNMIPLDWALSQRAWAAVTQYAFLEFYFVYAFNDYKEYATWPFENEHEGDVEGCCVVFERSALEDLAAGTKTAGQVTAHTVITSVHEEFHDSDCVKRLPLANAKARDDLVVYVAPGSHATYLTPGSHDFLDFEDVVTDLPAQLPTWVVVLAIIANLEVVVALLLLAGILEHFVGSDDETSDNGVSVGPGEPDPDPANLEFEKKIEVTPLSNILDKNDANIYQPAFRATQAIRGYQGKWGGDDGLIDHSPPWENKTARYFRNFLKYGQPSGVIV